MNCAALLVLCLTLLTETSGLMTKALEQMGHLSKKDFRAAVDARLTSVLLAVDAHLHTHVGHRAAVVGWVFLALFVFMMVLVVWVACWLGPAVRMAIQRLDRKVLGVDVMVDRVSLNLCSARLEIRDLRVTNPPGSDYASDHMLSVERLLLDMDVAALLCNGQIRVQRMILEKLYVLVEKHALRTSNVKEVVDFLEQRHCKVPPEQPQVQSKEVDLDSAKEAVKSREVPLESAQDELVEDAPAGERLPLTVKQVKVQDVGLRFQLETKIFGTEHTMGSDLALADLVFENFSEEHGAYVLDDVAMWLLKTVLKTVLTNIAGKRIGDHLF